MKTQIEVNPNIHFGMPCIAGTRITIKSVLELLREGYTFEQIIQDYYPDLEAEDVRASIQYAIDVLAAEDIHISAEPG